MAIYRYKITQTRSNEISIIAKDRASADRTIYQFNFDEFADDTIKVESEDVQFIESSNIMSHYNGHNTKFVELINKAYCYANADFMKIASILAERYKDEIPYDFTETYTPQDYIKVYLHDFLVNICDDMDLKIIISWCRISEEE